MSTKPIEDDGRGSKELTGMVDLTRDANGHTMARLPVRRDLPRLAEGTG